MAGRTERRPGYRKGGAASGGGSHTGGGGKRGRPQFGWEKGDVARDIADIHDPTDLPRKPGRPIPHSTESRGGGLEPIPSGKTIYDLLRAENHKTLVTLRKLEDTAIGRPEERERLRDELGERVAIKRKLEEDILFPLLLDHPELCDAVLAAREGGRDIDARLQTLRDTAAVDRSFKFEVEVLHGIVEHQIHGEESILPLAERLIPVDQAIDLADRFAG